MRMKTAVLALLLLAVSLPAEAGVRALMRIEVRKVAGPSAGSQDPIAAFGAALVEAMFPDGAVQVEWLAQDGSLRTEFRGKTMLLPEGGIVVARAGDVVSRVINPTDQTYFTLQAMTATPTLPGGGALPWEKTTQVHTGVFETIAGHRAEKVTINWRMKLPGPEGQALPSGVPDALTVTGEMWCTDDFKDSEFGRAVRQGNQMLGLVGIDFSGCPLPLRSTIQMSMMPGYELVTSVSSITEERLPDDLFRIPAGYREVPAPLPKVPR